MPVPVWLPVAYRIRHREYKHRNESHATARHDVALMLRDLDDAAAPVCAYVDPPAPMSEEKAKTTYSYGQRPPFTPPHAYPIRRDGSRLLRPVTLPDGRELKVTGVADLLEERLAAGRARLEARDHPGAALPPSPKPFVDYPLGYEAFSTERKAPEDFHEYRGDDREEAIAKAHRDAESLVVVDGTLYREALEPLILLDIGGAPNAVVLEILPAGVSDKRSEDGLVFRADEFEDAVAIAGAAAEAGGLSVDVRGSVEILQEGAFGFIRFADALKRFRKLLQQSCSELGALPVDSARHWVAAREHLDAFQGGRAEALAAASGSARSFALGALPFYKNYASYSRNKMLMLACAADRVGLLREEAFAYAAERLAETEAVVEVVP